MGTTNVADKVAVITGASRGLGAGMARALYERGLALGLCARSEPVLADRPRVVAARLDVADPEAVERLAERVAEELGPIDLWINNAGILDPIGPLRTLDSASFRRTLEVNVLGVVHGTGAFVRHLRRTGRPGVLINVSSGAARRAYAGWSAYCASKAAVELLTEAVALEEAEAGLRAHAVAPGVIDTDMQALIRSRSPQEFPEVERFLQLARDQAFNTPEHVADHLLRLAFDPSYPHDQVVVRVPAQAG